MRKGKKGKNNYSKQRTKIQSKIHSRCLTKLKLDAIMPLNSKKGKHGRINMDTLTSLKQFRNNVKKIGQLPRGAELKKQGRIANQKCIALGRYIRTDHLRLAENAQQEREKKETIYSSTMVSIVELLNSATDIVKKEFNDKNNGKPINDKYFLALYGHIWNLTKNFYEDGKDIESLKDVYCNLKGALTNYWNELNKSASKVFEGYWLTENELKQIKKQCNYVDTKKFIRMDEKLIKKWKSHPK